MKSLEHLIPKILNHFRHFKTLQSFRICLRDSVAQGSKTFLHISSPLPQSEFLIQRCGTEFIPSTH